MVNFEELIEQFQKKVIRCSKHGEPITSVNYSTETNELKPVCGDCLDEQQNQNSNNVRQGINKFLKNIRTPLNNEGEYQLSDESKTFLLEIKEEIQEIINNLQQVLEQIDQISHQKSTQITVNTVFQDVLQSETDQNLSKNLKELQQYLTPDCSKLENKLFISKEIQENGKSVVENLGKIKKTTDEFQQQLQQHKLSELKFETMGFAELFLHNKFDQIFKDAPNCEDWNEFKKINFNICQLSIEQAKSFCQKECKHDDAKYQPNGLDSFLQETKSGEFITIHYKNQPELFGYVLDDNDTYCKSCCTVYKLFNLITCTIFELFSQEIGNLQDDDEDEDEQ